MTSPLRQLQLEKGKKTLLFFLLYAAWVRSREERPSVSHKSGKRSRVDRPQLAIYKDELKQNCGSNKFLQRGRREDETDARAEHQTHWRGASNEWMIGVRFRCSAERKKLFYAAQKLLTFVLHEVSAQTLSEEEAALQIALRPLITNKDGYFVAAVTSMYQSLLEGKTDCPISGVFGAGKTQDDEAFLLSLRRSVKTARGAYPPVALAEIYQEYKSPLFFFFTA